LKSLRLANRRNRAIAIDKEIEVIRRNWQSLDISIRAGLSDKEIADFERRYGVRLPDGLRRFYEYMDGMEYGAADEEFISFWPLSEVGTVPEKLSGFRGVPDYGGIESSLPDASSYFVLQIIPFGYMSMP
jgi:hypothetical protein